MSDYDSTYNLDDIKESIDEAVSELQSIASILKKTASDQAGLWQYVWVLLIVVVFNDWSGSQLDRFTDRLWYSVADDTDWKNVNVIHRPTNCDFLRAPMGSKSCSYKKRTEVFGDKEREALVESALPVDKDDARRKPNSVLVYWYRQEEP